ncbi:helix-turn-helix transcriptional regulator [Aquihabitans sp. McL0605]|uniref:helix-turn-helix transcriptional regulator n=1 Tax=Aquihabitans sp. McL0605 TaxID=3415671 RepID=UPI003CED4033
MTEDPNNDDDDILTPSPEQAAPNAADADADGDNLSPKDMRLMELLLEGVTLVRAASLTGISERTASRRKKRPAFQAAFRSAQRDLAENVRVRLIASMNPAVDVINDLVAGAESERVQLAAAAIAIKLGTLAAQTDLEDRLDAVEAKLQITGVVPAWNPPPIPEVPGQVHHVDG